MPEPVLETNGLTKRFGSILAVDHVSLCVHPGDIYGFIGLNGAGKTTFIRMITGLAAPTEGGITLFGESSPAGLSRARGRTGSVVETPAFYEYMTARDNLVVQCRLSGVDPDRRVPEVLQAVGLPLSGKKRVKYFSLGMRQRLGLARAMVNRPGLLILDEPINGLDPAGIHAFREYLRDIAQREQVSVLISSHILSELSQLATRYGIIHEGRLIEEISDAQLSAMNLETAVLRTSDPDRAKEAILLDGRIPRADVESDPDGTIRVLHAGDRTSLVCRIVIEAGVEVSSLGTVAYTLEDHFMEMTGGKNHA